MLYDEDKNKNFSSGSLFSSSKITISKPSKDLGPKILKLDKSRLKFSCIILQTLHRA